MPTNLPTDLLRTLVAIADTGSITRATERIFRTQSALSLQIKRLEALVQTSLFRRDGRHISLTPAGESLLQHAREILRVNDHAVASLVDVGLGGPVRIGLIQDFADTKLISVMAQFARLNQQSQVQIRVGNSHDLKEMLASNRLDIVLCFGELSDPVAVTTTDLVWLGDPALLSEPAIPIAVLDEPCMFRAAAIATIERAGFDYRIILETPSYSVLMSVVKAGIALTCRTPTFLSAGVPSIDLPNMPLPRIAYALHYKTPAHPSILRLASLLEVAVLEL